MEKPQLVKFIAKVMEDSGFKVYNNFKTSKILVDIYAILPTQTNDFGAVVACKNYDKHWKVSIDILKEMEIVARNLQASKIIIVTTSYFSPQAINYAARKSIKLVDRNGLMKMAQKFIKRNKTKKRKVEDTYPRSSDDIYYEQLYLSQPSSYSQQGGNSYYSQQQYHQRPYGYRADLHKMPMQEQQPKSSRFSFLNRSNSQNQSRPQQPRRQRIPNLSNKSNKPNKVNKPNRPNRSNLQSQAYPNQESSFDYRKIFANPVVLIILVVIIAYLIAYILGGIGGLKSGVIGLIEMFVALVLSYGLVLALEKDGAVVLVKGSIVFFISLISLIALILFL